MLFGFIEPPTRRRRLGQTLGIASLGLFAALLSLLGAPAVAALAGTLVPSANGSVFYITNAQDSGKGSLRQAIIDANQSPSTGTPDTFTVPAGVGPLDIQLQTPLPAVQDLVFFDARGLITITDTFTTPSANGLVLGGSSSGSTLSGLTVLGAGAAGVLVHSSGDLITGNTIGDTNGTGHDNHNGLVVIGNNNTIGGTAAGDGNLITGNRLNGVVLQDTFSRNVVEGNTIGGATIGNGGYGVLIRKGAFNNTIGGTSADAANTITHNFTGGVHVAGSSTNGDAILGNGVFANGGQGTGPGIRLSQGANDTISAPSIDSVKPDPAGTAVGGTGMPGTRIEVFGNSSCADPEGAAFLGTTTTGSDGTWQLTVQQQASGSGLTATQTAPSPTDTSAFSRCVSSG